METNFSLFERRLHTVPYKVFVYLYMETICLNTVKYGFMRCDYIMVSKLRAEHVHGSKGFRDSPNFWPLDESHYDVINKINRSTIKMTKRNLYHNISLKQSM